MRGQMLLKSECLAPYRSARGHKVRNRDLLALHLHIHEQKKQTTIKMAHHDENGAIFFEERQACSRCMQNSAIERHQNVKCLRAQNRGARISDKGAYLSARA